MSQSTENKCNCPNCKAENKSESKTGKITVIVTNDEYVVEVNATNNQIMGALLGIIEANSKASGVPHSVIMHILNKNAEEKFPSMSLFSMLNDAPQDIKESMKTVLADLMGALN